MESLNISAECAGRRDNQTGLRVTGRADTAGYLFHSLIPYEPAVPVLAAVFLLLTLFSLVVNALTLYIIEKSDELSWQPRFVLCENLILSDLLQTTTFGPAVLYSLARGQTMACNPWCYLQYIVGTASIFSSLSTITSMALERYVYVCFALRYLVIVTRERLIKVLVLIWVYSISIGVTNIVLLLHGGKEESQRVTMGLLCEPDVMEQHMGSPRASAVFRKVFGTFTLLLCLLAHAFSYHRMYRNASNAVVPFDEVNHTARRTVMFYLAMLLLQLLPLLIKVASDVLSEFRGPAVTEPSSQTRRGGCKRALSATAAGFHVSLLIMLLVPPCVNPLVYGLRSAEMRKALADLLQWRADNRVAAEPPREMMRLRNIVHNDLAEAG